ncbi:MAG: hypothetical protein V4622_06750 [Bacteroidota bacterium]
MNIENYSKEFLELIEQEIGYIRNGDLSNENIKYIKKAIKIWFQKKGDDERPKIGYVSEFICHLYLRSKKFEQYFLFKNLEENGPKKGFDGLYLKDEEIWLVESKSTSNIQKNHSAKINEAYKDLKIKVESIDIKDNNPWENSKNHLDNRNIRENEDLSEKIKKLSQDFIDKNTHGIEEYNIIPSSTIFMGDNYQIIDVTNLKDSLEKLCKDFNAKKLNLVCVNKKSIDDFLKFIDG